MSTFDAQIAELKRRVMAMLAERDQSASPIWSEALATFEYVKNLSAIDFESIRYHAGLVVGESPFAYWHQFPAVDPDKFAQLLGYKFYSQGMPEKYWVGEPPTPRIPRLLGVDYKGRVINRAVGRYQSCVSNLHSMGILQALEESKKRNVVLEIGGGYGGLAHHLSSVIGKTSTCVIVDLPEMLLVSGGFLTVNNPGKRLYVYERATFDADFLKKGIYDYDFVLLPVSVLSELAPLAGIDLMINMASFQEMTAAQIDGYAKLAADKLTGWLYSDNMDQHPFNKGLKSDAKTVTGILESHLNLFPSGKFYDDHFKPLQKAPWFYRSYLGSPKNVPLRFPGAGPMRTVSGESKIGGTEYSLWFDGPGTKVRFKRRRSLSGELVTLARNTLRRIMKEDIGMYYQVIDES